MSLIAPWEILNVPKEKRAEKKEAPQPPVTDVSEVVKDKVKGVVEKPVVPDRKK